MRFPRLQVVLLMWSAITGTMFSTQALAQEEEPKTKTLPLHEVTPDFTLKALNGKNLKLSEQRGDVVVLIFWASWCNTCRQVLPVYNALYRNYKDAGLVVFGITVDDDPIRARQAAEQLKLAYPILMDAKRTVSEAYRLENTPTTFFIARDGSLRTVLEGYKPGNEPAWEQEIRQMLGE